MYPILRKVRHPSSRRGWPLAVLLLAALLVAACSAATTDAPALRATATAEAFFNAQYVVDGRLRTEFFKHLPGIFTGIGIIGTFLDTLGEGFTTDDPHLLSMLGAPDAVGAILEFADELFDAIGAQTLTFAAPAATRPASSVPGYFTSMNTFGLGGHPAGGGFGTVDDMLRVLNLIASGGSWQGKQLLKPKALKEMLTVQYAAQIAEAVAKGQPPAHESWGLGWLVRGTAPKCPAAHWFGFGDSQSPTLFGHAGVDTIYGDGDPARQLAYVFVMTGKPRDAAESTRLRREVSNRLQAAICRSAVREDLS